MPEEEGVRFPETRVTDSCELVNVNAGNRTPGLWKSSEH